MACYIAGLACESHVKCEDSFGENNWFCFPGSIDQPRQLHFSLGQRQESSSGGYGRIYPSCLVPICKTKEDGWEVFRDVSVMVELNSKRWQQRTILTIWPWGQKGSIILILSDGVMIFFSQRLFVAYFLDTVEDFPKDFFRTVVITNKFQ